MTTPRAASYICKNCRTWLNQKRNVATSTRAATLLQSGFAPLKSRRLLSVYGQDAAHFLQGLTTQSIPTSEASAATTSQVLYSAFMNASGRLLQDVFIYPLQPEHALRQLILGANPADTIPAFVIEVDTNQIKALYGFLRKYKLRAKVTIRKIEEGELSVYSAWDDEVETSTHSAMKTPRNSNPPSSLLVSQDPRIPTSWSRILASHSDKARIGEETGLDETSESVYRLKRYLNGVPEGQTELPPEATLLHEANIDLMHGVDFRKGCYVGQELVIRTQHTGVVRKRVMPVQIWSGKPPSEAEMQQDMPSFTGSLPAAADAPSFLDSMTGQTIKSRGARRPEGKFMAGVGNVGLALCRLETVVEPEDGVAKGRTRVFEVDTSKVELPSEQMEKQWVRPFIPEWWKLRGQNMEGGYESLKAHAPGRKT